MQIFYSSPDTTRVSSFFTVDDFFKNEIISFIDKLKSSVHGSWIKHYARAESVALDYAYVSDFNMFGFITGKAELSKCWSERSDAVC